MSRREITEEDIRRIAEGAKERQDAAIKRWLQHPGVQAALREMTDRLRLARQVADDPTPSL